jgi:hypothetical protein
MYPNRIERLFLEIPVAQNQPVVPGAVAHTPGPFTVRVSPKWPFNIETLDSAGEVVFSRVMPANSTDHMTIEDVLAAKGMEPACAEANRRALVDEILRAAAPDLAAAMQGLLATAREQHEALQSLLGLIASTSGAEIPDGSITAATQAFEDMDAVKAAVAALSSAGLR